MNCSKCENKEFEASGLCKIHLVERRKYEIRRIAIRKQNNLCLRCDKPPTPGKVKCEECRLQDRKNYKLRYNAKKAVGLCVFDGCQAPTYGKAQCEKHLQKAKDAIAKRRKKLSGRVKKRAGAN